MRVIVFGATGNVGSAVIRALVKDDRVDSVVGLARRLPMNSALSKSSEKVSWMTCDISGDSLDIVAGADAVVHLAWQIQPSRDEASMLRTNVIGTRRITDAVVTHDVPSLIYASSVGAYAPHTKDGRADESWPATGIASSTYSRHKSEVEAMLDVFERVHPRVRVVRMRTSLVFQRSAAAEIHRLFLGRLVPWHLPRALRFVPRFADLQFQATHADDIAEAYLRAILSDVAGAFNVAAEPVLDSTLIANAVNGRAVPVPAGLVRAAAAASYRLRIQPSEPGWLDMAMQTPLMDTSRARAELGWVPRRTSLEAFSELIAGIGDGAGDTTYPLRPRKRF